MTAAQKKAFVARMAKARGASTRKSKAKPKKKAVAKRKKPVTRKAAKQRNAPRRAKKRNGGVTHRATRRAGKSQRRRRNPEEIAAALAMYEAFHGRGANRVVEYNQALEYRDEMAELGRLVELRFRLEGEASPVPLAGFQGTQVACTPDGKNIYFVGGDQAIRLSELGIDSDKDYVELGSCTYIKYHTKKGFHDFQPIDYYHSFGEENGIQPVLMYDTQNKALFLAGGDYHCKPEGITN